MRLKADGAGIMIGLNGTALYLVDVRWQVVSCGRLRLAHLGSPSGFPPPDPNWPADEPQIRPFRPANEPNLEVRYALAPARVTAWVPSSVARTVWTPFPGRSVNYSYKLELWDSPWPPELEALRELPLVFFGHPAPVDAPAEPGAAPDPARL
jgi:hypothetical protein